MSDLAEPTHENDTIEDEAPPLEADLASDLVYWAWTIIANAGHNRGGWEAQDPEWVVAAVMWRDAFHASRGLPVA